MTYDPKRQLDSEPEPELIEAAQVFYALMGIVGLMLLALFNLLRMAYSPTASNLWLAGMHVALALCATANIGLLAVLLARVDGLDARALAALDLPAWPDPHPDGAPPREEEYSRVTEPQRYRIAAARARVWAEVLAEA